MLTQLTEQTIPFLQKFHKKLIFSISIINGTKERRTI
jgi:hypothetical protein